MNSNIKPAKNRRFKFLENFGRGTIGPTVYHILMNINNKQPANANKDNKIVVAQQKSAYTLMLTSPL